MKWIEFTGMIGVFKLETMKQAQEIFKDSLTFTPFSLEEIAWAYHNNGHTDKSFIQNMRLRAIYQDMVDLDDIAIERDLKKSQKHYCRLMEY